MTNNIFTQQKEVLDLIQSIMDNADTAEILDEKYKLYHKDFSSAMKHAYDTVKKMGYEVDPESINDKVAFGPRKPSSGKTNSYRLDLLKKGKPQKKGVQIQVYNMDNKSYELNMYLEGVELAEATGGLKMLGAADELEKYAKKYGGIDKKDFLKVAKMMRKGMSDKVVKMTNDLDTEPREKIVDVVANHIGVKSTEKMFGVKFLHRKESVELDENKKAELAKKLAKSAQSSKKGKDKVTLKKAPWDKKEEVQEAPLDEGKMSPDQIAKLKQGYESLRGKKISAQMGMKISRELEKLDKSAAMEIAKADIPFVSTLAINKLMMNFNMSGSAIRKLIGESVEELVELTKAEKDLISKMYDKKGNLTPLGQKVMDHGKKEELSPKQKKIDANNNGKVDGEDLAKLRSKKEEVLSQIKNLILDEGRKQVLAHGGKGQYKVVSTDGAVDVVFKGKVVGKGDYDRGADSFFISMKGQKGQKSFDDAQDIADYFAKNKIKEEVELQEYSALPTVETLKKMHDEGKTKKQIMAAYSGCDSVKLEKLYAQHCTEELEEMKNTHALINTADGNKVVAMASSEDGVKQSKASAQRPPMSIKDKNTLKIVKLKKPVSQKASDKIMGRPLNEETLDEKMSFSPKEVKMAIGVASDKRYAGGNMTGAVKAIDKIKKGLSNHPQVSAVLKRQNEEKTVCPQCEGAGCDHCDNKGYHEELSPKQKKIDKNKNGKIDGSDLASLRKKNEDFDVESLIESSDKKDAKEMADLVKELEPKIKMTELKKQVYDMAMEKYNNKTRAKKIASMIK